MQNSFADIFYLIKVKEGGNDLMGIRMEEESMVLFMEILGDSFYIT